MHTHTHTHTHRYASRRQGRVENASLVTSALSLYVGLFFLLGDVSAGVGALLAFCLVAVNAGFAVLCVAIIVRELRDKAARRMHTHTHTRAGQAPPAGGVEMAGGEVQVLRSNPLHAPGTRSARVP